MSNQMQRLIGYRPSMVRESLGWEWLFESWLRREAESGGLSPRFAENVVSDLEETRFSDSDSSPHLETA